MNQLGKKTSVRIAGGEMMRTQDELLRALAREPAERPASALELVAERRWRWPGPVSLVRRVEARPRP